MTTDNQRRDSTDDTTTGTNPSAGTNAPFLEFDCLFDTVGGFGRYQIFVGFLVQWSCLLLAGNGYMMSFGTLAPTWRCDAYPINETVDHCHFMNNCTGVNNTSLLRAESFFYSVIQQYQLTCDKDYIPNMMISIQMLGLAVGSPAGGHLADHLGRKVVTWVGLTGCVASGLLCAIAPSWKVLAVFMFLLGFFLAIYHAALFVLAMELTGKRHRIITSCCFSWSISFQVAALVAYLSRDWRIYAATVNCLCSPLLILYFFLYESPRWLIQKKKYQKACKILNKIAKWNKRKELISPESLKTIQFDTSSSSYSFLSLFSTKRLAVYSIICLISCYVSASVSGVILFNVGKLVGSPFLNVALYGMIRIWTPPFMVLMEMKSSIFGRRPMYLSSLAFVILCFAGIIAINSTGTASRPWLIIATALSLAGSCINASIFDTAITLYSTELFPTVIRAIAVGTFNIADSAGLVIAPQLLYLQKYWKQIPYVVVISFATLAWLMAFFILPETGGEPLPDKLTEVTIDTANPVNNHVQNGGIGPPLNQRRNNDQ